MKLDLSNSINIISAFNIRYKYFSIFDELNVDRSIPISRTVAQRQVNSEVIDTMIYDFLISAISTKIY